MAILTTGASTVKDCFNFLNTHLLTPKNEDKVFVEVAPRLVN